MDERRRGWAVATVAMLVALACSGPIVTGDAMIDAGELLEDAGRALADAGDALVPDASAQAATYEAECEPHVVLRLIDRASGNPIDETTHYYAEVNVPGLTAANVESATAVMCEREVFGIASETCNADWICERAPVEVYPCDIAHPELADGRLRVQCGTLFTSHQPDLVRRTGSRWTHVRFVVR